MDWNRVVRARCMARTASLSVSARAWLNTTCKVTPGSDSRAVPVPRNREDAV